MLVLVERTAGLVVGTSWLTSDGRRVNLHHFGILPPFQGKGLAKLLLAETLKAARKIGFQLKLEVQRNNTTALGLYQKAGFRKLGDYDIYIIREVNKLS